MHERRPVPRGAWIGLLLAILAGTALRLAWGADIEFKYDEHWLFEHALVTGPGALPWLGEKPDVAIAASHLDPSLLPGLPHARV